MKLKRVFLIGLAIAGAYGIAKFCNQKTSKFALTEIESSRPFDSLFETRSLNPAEQAEVAIALDQPYTYFGCGGQAFVFFSDDGKYVLKFFKQRHFSPPTYLKGIPFIDNYRARKYFKRRKRLELDYGSYKIGFEELPLETGLLYLHLNKTSHLQTKLKVRDKLNIEHTIDLDQTDFILQRKADLVHTRIDQQMAQHDVAGAQETIAQVLSLIVTRCKKGYDDRDPNIATNCGILNGKAIKIDVGRFTRNPNMAKPLYYKPEVYYLSRPFRAWLKGKYPELALFLDEELTRIIVHD